VTKSREARSLGAPVDDARKIRSRTRHPRRARPLFACFPPSQLATLVAEREFVINFPSRGRGKEAPSSSRRRRFPFSLARTHAALSPAPPRPIPA